MSTKKKTDVVDTDDIYYYASTDPGGKDDVLARLTGEPSFFTPTDEDALGRKLPRTAHVTVKLGSIEEAAHVSEGAVVVAVNRSSGEITLSVAEGMPAFTSPRAIVQ